jgi:prevent-host-death family protein
MRAVAVELFEHLFEELVDEVSSSREPIVITRSGKPIACLEPIARRRAPQSLWGAHKRQIDILGERIEPLDLEWEVNAEIAKPVRLP